MPGSDLGFVQVREAEVYSGVTVGTSGLPGGEAFAIVIVLRSVPSEFLPIQVSALNSGGSTVQTASCPYFPTSLDFES